MFDKTFLKIICICSFILGAILGLIPVIPPLMWIAVLLQLFFISPFLIIYLKRLNIIKSLEINNCMAVGAISGFVSFVGFAVIFFPLASVLNVIFKVDSFLGIKVILTNFGFFIPMVFFTALLSALLNAFSGFLTVYVYNFFGKK